MGNSDQRTERQIGETPLTSRTAAPTGVPTGKLDQRYRAQLIVLAGIQTGKRIPLRGETVIGRSTAASVCIPDPHISRQHVRIWRQDDSYMLQDLGSHNGTAINGRPVEQEATSLSFGDKVRIGKGSMLLFTHYDDLEEQVLQSQKLEALGQLAGGVAHEFNNMLAIVVGNVGVVRSAVTDPEMLSCLDDIQTATSRATALNRQLLNFSSRSRSGHRVIELSRLTEEVCELARRTFDRSVQVDASIAPGLELIGDPAQLHQVLMNLLINGRDAMRDGGTLTVQLGRMDSNPQSETAQEGPQIMLTVQDTGPGMDEETRRRIFEPFVATAPNKPGGGLALSTVHGIVQNHGGQLTLESEPGQGSRFQILLPLVEPAQKDGRSQTIALHKDDQGSILVVDDEPLVASTVTRLLRSLGYEAIPATTLDEAVSLARKHISEIQLILLDAAMPEHQGKQPFDTLQQLGSIPIVLTSGFDHDEQIQTLLDAGAVDFLSKPFTRQALKETLSRSLGANLGDLDETL